MIKLLRRRACLWRRACYGFIRAGGFFKFRALQCTALWKQRQMWRPRTQRARRPLPGPRCLSVRFKATAKACSIARRRGQKRHAHQPHCRPEPKTLQPTCPRDAKPRRQHQIYGPSPLCDGTARYRHLGAGGSQGRTPTTHGARVYTRHLHALPRPPSPGSRSTTHFRSSKAGQRKCVALAVAGGAGHPPAQ